MRKTIISLGVSLIFLNSISIATESALQSPVYDTLDISQYIGVFKYSESSPVPFVKIEARQNKLFASAEGYPETQLHFKSLDIFTDSVYGVEFKFIRAGNKVDTLIVDANGASLIAVRVKDEKTGDSVDKEYQISLTIRDRRREFAFFKRNDQQYF